MNPLFINIVSTQNFQSYSNMNLNGNIEIISPVPNEKVYSNDLVIILSYYELDNLDYSSIQIFIDDKDLTQRANIKDYHLILHPPNLIPGKHTARVLINSTNDIAYEPLEWSFILLDKSENLFKYNGKISHNSLNNDIDNQKSYSNISNVYFNGKTEWTNFYLKFKKTSLENSLIQPQDRYSLLFKHNIFDFNVGDFYPQFNELVLHGNRVRGIGFDLRTKLFQINLIKGQLNRSIQGSPYNSLALDYSTDNILTISRDNYEFEDEITALRLGLGGKKINFGLNLVKVKDDIKSVNLYVNGSIINLDAITQKYNSDLYIDYDNDGEYNSNNGDKLYSDNILHINGIENEFNDIESIVESPEFIVYEKIARTLDICDVNECPECIDGCPIKQNTWSITIMYNQNLQEILNHSFPNENLSVEYLEKNWSGNKPKDNFVVGTDMKLDFDRFKINSSIGINLLNENIWNPIISIDDFDTYADEYEDCYYGRTYDLDLDNDGENDINSDDLIWDENCISQYGGTLIVNEEGISLDDIPNPQDFEDFFHYNFDAIPTIPFYKLIQKRANDEDIKIKDFLNSPEIAYDFDVRLLYPKHTFQFGIKKVGPSFTSLANPYLQQDTKEKYISERIRLLSNRIFLFFSLKSIENGLNQESESGKSNTDKYDMNISFYPIKNLPKLTLSYSFYTKEGGEKIEFQNDNNEIIDYTDTRINTETVNSSISLNHNFILFKNKFNFGLSYYESEKIDLLDYLILTNPNYISSSSNSNNYNLNLKSYINNHWSTDFYLSSSYFDFSKEYSEYYQEQNISTIRLGFSFKNKSIIEKISTWLDYSKGEGTTDYNQYGVKLSADLNLYKNLLLNLNLRHYYKDLSHVTASSFKNSKNFIFRANLSYNF